MSEKRRQSTRNRGEPPLKKRQSPPPPPLAPPPVAVETQKGLPPKLQENQALPILKEMQDLSLPTTEYQTIMESGVLAASIEQSRRKWVTEGVFERYWAKPSKKRSQDAQNPSKESMSRLGLCSMVIEPHVFEVTFTERPSSRSSATQPISTPLPPFREGFARFDPHGLSSYQPSYTNPPSHPAAASPNAAISPSGAVEANGAQLQSPKPSPDPVIQMLATRAASDHGLKALMKMVASGRATQTQLREFQNHIDDLNAEIKAGRGPLPVSPHDGNPPRPPPPGGPSLASVSTQSVAQIKNPTASQPSTYGQPAPIKLEDPPKYYHPYQQPVKPKSIIQYKSDISAVVFDFGGSGDRFSIPRFSILEYLPGANQVIVSFLVIRKGDASLPGNYKDNLSYYQPVTMRLSTPQPRTLEPLAKVVAPAEEVRRYMESVFDKMSPIETSFLATRLPRVREEDSQATKERAIPTEEPVSKTHYPPPSSLVPLVA
ncbi:hypothetical protein G7Y79_00028g062860 [Physcia stellaris]|nr:hypothetical protein G7Y79_00028g062860 [Physcia stellaris]